MYCSLTPRTRQRVGEFSRGSPIRRGFAISSALSCKLFLSCLADLSVSLLLQLSNYLSSALRCCVQGRGR